MEREISVFSKLDPSFGYDIVIGTHPGIFHADEVVAISLLHLYYECENIGVMRTYNLKELHECDLLVDIGGGELDHHQAGGNGSRQNGIKYASAGLVWKKFGEKIVDKLANKVEGKLNKFQISSVASQIDDEYIQAIDETDNGVCCDNELFYYIEAFLPDWYCCDNRTLNENFSKAVKITIEILERLIRKAIEKEASYHWMISSLASNHSRILEVPAQTFPWQEALLIFNGYFDPHVDFVIFPYPAAFPPEGWGAQCVPPNMTQPFEKRIPFPKSWAGQTDKLPEISGIPDAVFCHNNCFLVCGNTKEAVIKMCEKAIEIFENSKKSK